MQDSSFLRGGGETGALMRGLDWECTAVGPPTGWPHSLRTLVGVLLESKFPTLLCWGADFVQFYNDPFRPILGATKHPALGKSARETFAEAWHIVGPLFAKVMSGSAVGFDDMLVPLDRNGFLEECYFTYSYSPVRIEDGTVGGILVTCTETSGRVIGERRLRLLQQLGAEAPTDNAASVCRNAADLLARDRTDVPWAAIYLSDRDGGDLRLAASTGIEADAERPPVPGAALRVDESGPWPGRAFVAPLQAAQGAAFGALVAGIQPMLPVDDQYRAFVELVAREIAGAIARARALEEEKQRSDALAAIDRAKTAFFANVSHEFRTPLTLMLSPTEEAMASPERVLTGDDLATVHRNALRLLKLVNVMLDFAAVEAGRMRATFEAIDLAQLTTDLASTFRSAVERAGLRFDVRCGPLRAPIHVDRDAWEKIVLNLLSNALKFTFHGGIAVSLEDRDDRAVLEVRDSGVGIPEAELPHVFDRFHRVAGTRGRTHEGSGIGLALVQELVKMHGGSLTVASRVGEGTVFTVSVPAGTAHLADQAVGGARAALSPTRVARPYVEEALRWLPSEAAAVPDVDRRSAAGGTRPRIVVADDNTDMREYVTRLLADRWQVDAVADGSAALHSALANRPALVVADVMMPGLHGFALLRELRAQAATKDVPVILLSARAGEEAAAEALAAGADDYIIKPFSARDLRARVEAQLLHAEVRAIEAAHDRRLADIFRHAPIAVALMRGPGHVFEFANDEYLAVIGHRPLLGRRFEDALPELGPQGVGHLLDEVYASAQPFTAEAAPFTINRGRAGAPEDAFFSFVFQPLRSHAGEVDGIAVMAIDVTELVRARRDAEAANRAKDQFLAVLGHELRNPLAPILTAVRLLDLKGPADPALQRVRDTIRRQTMQLGRLVEDLLDVGRMMTGKLRLNRARTDVESIVRQAVETCLPAIQDRRHTLTLSLPDQPLVVDADRARLVQVLCNLLNNATKYMPEGGRITLSATGNGDAATITVRDEGVGIPRDMLDRVFDRFVQIDGSDDEARSGLGIGLSVVRAIVELHGGTVVARSDGPGAGAEFSVSVPTVAAASVMPT